MKKISFRLIFVTLVGVVALMMDCSFAQELPSCSDETVIYSAFDENFAAKMAVQPGPAQASTLIMGKKQFSPQKSRWMIVSNPDYMKPGPWTTVVWVGGSAKGGLEMLTFC